MSASLESLLHAFTNLFFKLNPKPQKAQKRLNFCEDEVKASLDMVRRVSYVVNVMPVTFFFLNSVLDLHTCLSSYPTGFQGS